MATPIARWRRPAPAGRRSTGQSRRQPAAGFVLVFVATTVWWLTQDDRFVDSATGQHILTSLSYRDSVWSGDLLAPLSDFNFYPPFVHIIGMGGLLLGGVGYAGPVLAQNLFFVSLLALGCYGAGSVAYDRRVGGLAALFALGTPMVIAHSHVFMLDLPLTAMVAVSVWLMLASDRFSRLGYSSLAGAAGSLGMMTKSTFAVFVAGLLAAALIRGGWRNWRGVGLFAAAGLAACAPWYLAHMSEVTSLTEQGRYAFTGICAYAALAVFASLALGRRRFPAVLTALVSLVLGLNVASQLFVLSNTFG